jgi:hypothetical protein
MTTKPEGIGGGDADRLTLLGRGLPNPVGQASMSRICDAMGAQRVDPAIQGGRDVEPRIARGPTRKVQPPNAVRGETRPARSGRPWDYAPPDRRRPARRSRQPDGRCG